MSCLCVCGVVEFEVELGIKLVLHHAAVADKTAIVEVIQWSRVEGRNLRGERRGGEGRGEGRGGEGRGEGRGGERGRGGEGRGEGEGRGGEGRGGEGRGGEGRGGEGRGGEGELKQEEEKEIHTFKEREERGE